MHWLVGQVLHGVRIALQQPFSEIAILPLYQCHSRSTSGSRRMQQVAITPLSPALPPIMSHDQRGDLPAPNAPKVDRLRQMSVCAEETRRKNGRCGTRKVFARQNGPRMSVSTATRNGDGRQRPFGPSSILFPEQPTF